MSIAIMSTATSRKGLWVLGSRIYGCRALGLTGFSLFGDEKIMELGWGDTALKGLRKSDV